MNQRLGDQLSLWTLIPFVCMLLAVAVVPVVAEGWFHRDRNKAIVSVLLGLPTLLYLAIAFGRTGLDSITTTAEDYVSFVVLLLALYTISGGIHLGGDLVGNPWTNLGFLAVGAVLANLIGTMGASMLLIRPLLRANAGRRHARHTVIFFIFAVSNIGGMLTPLGDPPLFLGFLRGVPFFWTLRLWPQWLLALGLLFAAYAAFELHYYRKEPERFRRADRGDRVPMRVRGRLDVLLLALVITAVVFSDSLLRAGDPLHFPFVRELVLLILTVVSIRFGPRGPRLANQFQWAPMAEVAIVFAGIFATMIPALALLQARGASVGLTNGWHYFWTTGWLSAFLDNAPTYLAFTSVAQGQFAATSLSGLATAGAASSAGQILAAISCSAVMFGAITYVGNAPNFMVRSITQRYGLRMPSFLGFMRYSTAVLVPIFVIVTVVFFL